MAYELGAHKKRDPGLVTGFQAFADIHGCESLAEDCQKFIDQNFQSVSEGDEFLRLPTEAILRILSSDSLNVGTEERVYESAMAWVNYDRQGSIFCHLYLDNHQGN